MGWLKPRADCDYPSEHTLAPAVTQERRTLGQRLQEGRLPAGEALRLAAELAQALRILHDQGRAHGALSPSAVELTFSGIDLIPGRALRGVPTPYAAPEILNGQKPDARSDIFSFGAIFFEMLTGRWAFEADTPEALAIALQNQPTPWIGNPAADVLLAHCLAKDPAARCQSMRKAQMELKLASVAWRQTQVPPRREQFESAVRSAVGLAIQSQVEGRLESHGTAVAHLRQSLAVSAERISRIERAAETVEKHSGEFAASTAIRLEALEQTVRAQAAALEAARTALAQTDDLVERVVEALDSLQGSVLEPADFVHGAVTAPQGRAARPISG